MKVVFCYSDPAATQKFLYSASILNSSIEYVLTFSQIAATNYIINVIAGTTEITEIAKLSKKNQH